MKQVTISAGTIHHRDVGQGPVVVFVHGFLTDHHLWDGVVDELSASHRCIAPDWPFGSHQVAMNPDADLSPTGMAQIVADFLAALDLRDVILVGNDSGGAISQITAANHPLRIGALVLTPCDAYEVFPPKLFGYLKWLAALPGAVFAMSKLMRVFTPLLRTPIAYGWATKYRIPSAQLKSWVAQLAGNAAVRRDAIKMIKGIHPRYTIAAAEALRTFDKPVLLVWTEDKTFFPLRIAERLQRELPNARLVRIPDAGAFLPLDQPSALASEIESLSLSLSSSETSRRPAGKVSPSATRSSLASSATI